MKEVGVVEGIGDRSMRIHLAAARPEMCRRCRACEILGEGKEMILRVPAAGGLAVGDRVAVEVPEVSPWTGIVLVLGLPVTLMVAGLVIGSRWDAWASWIGLEPDLSGAVLGIALGVLAFLAARAVDRRYLRRIRITRIGATADGEGA